MPYRAAMSMRLSSMAFPLCDSSCFLKIAFCSSLLPMVLAFRKWSSSQGPTRCPLLSSTASDRKLR